MNDAAAAADVWKRIILEQYITLQTMRTTQTFTYSYHTTSNSDYDSVWFICYLQEITFVRCIKPNETFSPSVFNEKFVEMQLKCFSIVEYKTLMEAGFPNRVGIDEFLKIYDMLSPKRDHLVRRLRQQQKVLQLEMLIRSTGLYKNAYRVGSSRVCFRFLKTDLLNQVLQPTKDQVVKVRSIYEKKLNSLQRWIKMKKSTNYKARGWKLFAAKMCNGPFDSRIGSKIDDWQQGIGCKKKGA